MVEEWGVVFSKWAGLHGANVKEFVACRMSICVVGPVVNVEFVVGTDEGGVSVVAS
jgi:hypothetical protein